VLKQIGVNFFASVTVTLGLPLSTAGDNLRAPALNAAYFSSPNSANWFIYAVGIDPVTATTVRLYAVPFAVGRNLVAGPASTATSTTLSGGAGNSSPLTEFLNSGTDRLFHVVRSGTGRMSVYNITAAPPAVQVRSLLGAGLSGGAIIVDNVSTQLQASSIYFAPVNVTPPSATKLTQAALQ